MLGDTTNSTGTHLGKWRARLALELSCLTTAREHLACALNTGMEDEVDLYLDLARNACTLVRKELNAINVGAVYEKVGRYEGQAIEQLALLTAADVEMHIADDKASNEERRKKYQLHPLYECRDFRRPLSLLLALA